MVMSTDGCSAAQAPALAAMRSTSTPANRNKGSTVMRVAPRRRHRSSASSSDGLVIAWNAGSTSPRPRPSLSKRTSFTASAQASGSVEPRPMATMASEAGG